MDYIATACFFISLKTSNFLIQIKYIIEKFCIFENIINDDEKLKIKDKVLYYESDILFTINFSLVYELPYPFLKNIMRIGDQAIVKMAIQKSENNIIIDNPLSNIDKEEDKIKKIKETLSEIVNYSFLFPFFLYYDTETISLSCLKLAFNKLNIPINITDIINIIQNQKETEIVSIDVNAINDIEICSSLIDELVLSKIYKTPHLIENNINNINPQTKPNFLITNAEYDAETKQKNEVEKKSKNEIFLQKKRK